MTILYDNNSFRPDLQTAWGFACFIEGTEKTILFDTGGDGQILLSNMEKLRISPEKVDIVFLSHVHGDHTGGLDALLKKNHNVTVFLPISFPEKMKAGIREKKAKVVEVKQPQAVCQGGIAIITGCAHPGIVSIVAKANELSKSRPVLTLGGFHMAGFSDKRIEAVIGKLRELGLVRIAPCHCSGDRTRELFSEAYGNQFIGAGAGSVIKLELAP